MSDTDAIIEDNRKVITGFLDKHHLDWFYDVGGCETCGPEYKWNCSCGVSGIYESFSGHQEEMAEAWLGDSGPEITKEGDVEW